MCVPAVHNVQVSDLIVKDSSRPVALVTGVGRQQGIGFAVAERLARDGFDIATSYWAPYDKRTFPNGEDDASTELNSRLDKVGARLVSIESDLEKPEVVLQLFDTIEENLGTISILVMCHCESVDSGISDTTIESFDRHFAVNARATWLLIREFGRRYKSEFGRGRVLAFTSDHTVGNVPYGASKGALDRITMAAAQEFASIGVTANVINPGPTDTGWMTSQLRSQVESDTPLGRIGTPVDAANLVSFLCSVEGGWVNGQLINSNGGLHGG
jgi:3-oxoacyl-[acyl-carrier protein] reductase